eukprot:Plantae.Rhodophyta-Hildenbrandia_rubra.ctg1043.p1 GENE.Plantae.Rhodophyta-Hildenbrandia_rubra.ctg1043~~Plantae.Rhodophyta-Hildenbrandia_rubra.ctg1043.p1  ORF type:complete len:673 (-),score=131.00 Plantae.Rhodophyta-Hildenbrandia_rubra.ctg1043:165-2183(-)
MGRRLGGGGSLNSENMLYDDSASQLFFVAMLAVYWIPTVLFRLLRLLRRRWRSKAQIIDENARNEICVCSLCMNKSSSAEKDGKKLPSRWDVLLIVVTVILAFSAVKVYTANLEAEQPFDPFEILKVSRDAGKREISKAYRRLSLLYHPDKNPGDPEASDNFVKLAKAHAALTDPTGRKNYAKYGNPDGRQGTTLGIALPAWVSEHNMIILIIYFMLFLIAFPAVIGMWWMNQSQMLTKHVSKETFEMFAETLVKLQKFREYVTALATANEFSDLYKKENDPKIAQLIVKLRKEDAFDLKKAKWIRQLEASQVQNLVVMMAHLYRIPIPSELQYVLDGMLRSVEPLTTAFADTMGIIGRPDCAKVYPNHRMRGNVARLELCLSVSQHITQALSDKSSQLLQIPHFTPQLARMCISPRGVTGAVKSVHAFAKLDPEDQKTLTRGLSDEELLDVKAFCDRYPRVTLEMSEPFVEDEDDGVIRASDRITITATLTVCRSAGSVYSPHCPYLPTSLKKKEIWWAILSDQKLNCPIEIRRLLPKDAKFGDVDRVASAVTEEELNPSTTVYNLKFNFMAPRPGTYTYNLKTDVDCYVECAQSKQVTVNVLEAVEPDESQLPKYFDTDDESSSEEDSESDEFPDREETDEDEDDEGSHDCETCDEEEPVLEFRESDTEL